MNLHYRLLGYRLCEEARRSNLSVALESKQPLEEPVEIASLRSQ